MINVFFEDHGDITILTIGGEFFFESVEFAEQIWNKIVQKKPRVIGINCRDIKFIDSSAIGVLVKFLNNAMKQGIELVFFDLSDTIMNVFKTAKLSNFFTILTREQFERQYLA